MNDFLQSLRGNTHKEKRVPKTRRGVDSGSYNTAPGFQGHGNYQGTRGGNLKRPTTRATAHPHSGDQQPPFISMEPLDIMMELMDVYTKNQELLINVQERRVLVEERKAIALEEMAEYMRVATSSDTLKRLLTYDADSDADLNSDDAPADGFEKDLSDAAPPEFFSGSAPESDTPSDLLEGTALESDGNAATFSEVVPEPGLPIAHGSQGDATSAKEDYSHVSRDSLAPGEMPEPPVNPLDGGDIHTNPWASHQTSVPEEDTVSGDSVKNLGGPFVKRVRRETIPSSSDDLFSHENHGTSTKHGAAPERSQQERGQRETLGRSDDKNVVLRKRVSKKEVSEKSVGNVSKGLPRASGNQTVTVIKRKKPDVKTENKVGGSGEKTAAAVKESGKDGLLPREEVMAIIQSMREKGSTFDEVAKHLVELGQPTFSGRGEWHAQTIHRLCSRKEKKKKT